MHVMKIDKIEYHPSSKGYILILKKDSGKIKIPILIGSNEAQSLSLAYEDIRLPRPTTHDLIINLINDFNSQLKHVIINKYENGTFFATIVIKIDNQTLTIDSRPSDAISIALKRLVPIYATDDILKQVESKNLISKQHFPEQTHKSKKTSNTITYDETELIDKLMEALNQAVNDENYEIAAKIRDRIKNLKTKQIN